MKVADPEVLIVGGGLAGLCCGIELQKSHIPFKILEADDQIGGRVQTDVVDGFLLDRGFQVLLFAYPECRRMLDYEALKLRRFYPGALIWFKGRFHRITDPWRQPFSALKTVFSPIGTLNDKIRISRLRRKTTSGTLDSLFEHPETSTLLAIKEMGFSDGMINRFFKPFFGGIFLDRALETSSRMLEFTFRMFSTGDAVIPEQGMGQIPKQLASHIPSDAIQTQTTVRTVKPHTVELSCGEVLSANAVVVATEGHRSAKLIDGFPEVNGRSATCLYFAADKSPVSEPVLILNGENQGVINNLCVPSVVSPTYSAGNSALISVTVLGNPDQDDKVLEESVREHLSEWFGLDVRYWQHLRTYRIQHALPQVHPPALTPPQRPIKLETGLYVCGDHRDTPSVHGAMVSGRRTAEVIVKDLR